MAPASPQFLFQGVLDKDRRGTLYGEISWKLGLRDERPYSTALVVRVLLCACILAFYLITGDLMFLAMLGIVGLGLTRTGPFDLTGCRADRTGRVLKTGRPNAGPIDQGSKAVFEKADIESQEVKENGDLLSI